MARLYANENFPLPVVEELRRLGHGVITTLDVAAANQSIDDDVVLAFAAAEQRALLTLNRKHFFRLHRQGEPHTGIIACTWDPNFVAQAHRIDAALHGLQAGAREVLRVNRPPR